MWAPVKPPNKGILDESSEKSKIEAIVPAKSDQQVHNLRNKRAEMERYIPKPVAKEMAQQESSQQMVSSISQAPVLRLGAQGREIDEHGNVVNITKPSNLSTLKVNINKQKKDAFEILKPVLEVDPESNPHFDEKMGIDKTKLLLLRLLPLLLLCFL